MDLNRDFKGVWIPKSVYENQELSALDKIIFAEIDSLDNGENGCFASNAYLAEFCKCSERKVSESISILIKLGFVQLKSFNGRVRVLQSRLAESARQTSRKCEADMQNLRGEIDYNNISNNSINNIEKEKYSKEKTTTTRFKPPTLEEVTAYCNERNNNVDAEKFIDYYISNGWKVGRNSMKDWKATVRTWERTNKQNNNYSRQYQPQMPSSARQIDVSKYDRED